VDESGRAQVVRGLMHTAWMATHHGRWSEAATLVRVARMLEEGQAPHTIPLFLAMFQPLLIQFHAQMMAPDAPGPEIGEAAPLSTGLMGSEPPIGRGGLWLPSGMKGDG
ncbi:MAG: hypothetical protein AAFS10_24900, partial [Myxococcota bacterium]